MRNNNKLGLGLFGLRRSLAIAGVGSALACGGIDGGEGADVEASLQVGRQVLCLPAFDTDGDGILDGHDLSQGLVDANSRRDCEVRFGGAVWGSLPDLKDRFALTAGSGGGGSTQEVPVPPSVVAAAAASGIPDREYRDDPQPDGSKGYDCDDFAGDLEKYLTNEDIDATFTIIVTYNDKGKVTSAHAITDIHTPGGGTGWIEPQTGLPVKLDQDGDGKVGTGGAYDGPTEGNTGVEIFDNVEEAAAKYRLD